MKLNEEIKLNDKNIKSKSDYITFIHAENMYKEIIDAIGKYDEILDHNGFKIFGDTNYITEKASLHLFGLKLRVLGLDIDPKQIKSFDWIRFQIDNNVSYYVNKKTDNRIIAWYGNKHNRYISSPKNDIQPKNELLLRIEFPTGAYIFGDNYYPDIFHNLYNSLKAYKPDYEDNQNHTLYWKIEKANKVFNAYPTIFETYKKQYENYSFDKRISELEKEIENLTKQKKS
jgi:hypothetical protein